MQSTGFVSSWLGGSYASFSQVRSSSRAQAKTCQRPSMALRDHEELETIFEGGDFKSAKYRLDLTISAETSKENRKLSVQQVKKNGNFNGFRKGTIPPYIMKQVEEFVLRDCIEGEIMSACDELDLKLLEGEASDPDLDFKELKSRFVISKDFDFSCEIALQSDYKKVADAEDAASAAIDMVADSSEEKSEDESAKTATV